MVIDLLCCLQLCCSVHGCLQCGGPSIAHQFSRGDIMRQALSVGLNKHSLLVLISLTGGVHFISQLMEFPVVRQDISCISCLKDSTSFRSASRWSADTKACSRWVLTCTHAALPLPVTYRSSSRRNCLVAVRLATSSRWPRGTRSSSFSQHFTWLGSVPSHFSTRLTSFST